jgi:FtsH-binding integral membrane protein
MDATSLALKVYLILGFELAVLYGCMFLIVQQCKKAFYANTTFLGIAFAEAVNQNRQTDITIVQSNGSTHFFFFFILFSIISMWTAAAVILLSTSFIQIVFMTLSAICYGSLIGFIIIDMDENDGMTGLKLATLTTAAMFIVVAITGINFANPIFVSIVVALMAILLSAEIYSMFNQISRGTKRKKAIAGIVIFSMCLLASISSVDVSAAQGLNNWDTAISLAFTMYLDIINIILYFLEAMGRS